ncbi:MAG TPA: shikimate kinase [Pyrinomonadaceae bacterium]|jgi:shikimate kinase|nr:shikimate kinase [Pyrinomonadaceae bacterium]
MNEQRIVFTGFMGVGKSTVARHVGFMLKTRRIDLDRFIEEGEGRTIAEIIEQQSEAVFRDIESQALKTALTAHDAKIISLGGGTWTFEENRKTIREKKCLTIWLNAPFEHCWRNIQRSKNKRPLLQNKENARRLYDDRQKVYCLADWHFVIHPDQTSLDVARQIIEEIF